MPETDSSENKLRLLSSPIDEKYTINQQQSNPIKDELKIAIKEAMVKMSNIIENENNTSKKEEIKRLDNLEKLNKIQCIFTLIDSL